MDSVIATTPEQEVFATTARLVAVQHAVAKAFGGEPMDVDPRALEDAVRTLRAILRSIDGAYGVIIGGLAVQHHGYKRYTEDVDMVVDHAHFREVVGKLRESGFVLEPNFVFVNKDSGAEIDLLQEGVRLFSATDDLPHPSALGKNGWFADLPALIFLKLESKRRQDYADIVALMRTHLNEADAIEQTLPERFKAQFKSLAAEAQSEIAAARSNAKATFNDINL